MLKKYHSFERRIPVKNIPVRLFPFVVLFLLVTEDKANMVLLSRTGEAEIEFTKEQLEIIQDVLPEFEYEVITLMPEHLSRINVVVIELLVPDDYPDPRSFIRMDPQPSP